MSDFFLSDEERRERRKMAASILIPVVLGLMIYLTVSFVNASFDISNWSEIYRVFAAGTWFILSCLIINTRT